MSDDNLSGKTHSPVFGLVDNATESQRSAIEVLVDRVPIDVFGALNKLLNSRGMMIHVTNLGDGNEP